LNKFTLLFDEFLLVVLLLLLLTGKLLTIDVFTYFLVLSLFSFSYFLKRFAFVPIAAELAFLGIITIESFDHYMYFYYISS